VIEHGDLESLEDEVARALRTGDPSGLRLIGHGEISIALGWPPDEPKVACKRLPPFRSLDQYRAYEQLVERYIDALEAGGVRVVETELHHLVRPDGSVVGFHLQPVLPAESLGTEILARSEPVGGHPLVRAVVDTVVAANTDRVGIDAQFSNWSWRDGAPWQLDLTTPFMVRADGEPELELGPFLAIMPAVIRPVVRREMVKLMHRWMSARGALADMAANVIKAGLDPWLDPVLEVVNGRVDPPVTRVEAQKLYDDDRRLFPLLLRLQRTNRWWQRHVRRRPFEFLLPEHTTYERRAHPGT
jgi:hypothetical protein